MLNENGSDLLTLSEAAAQLKVRPATLRAWRLRRYGLDFVLCGRLVRITTESVQRYIREHTVPAVQP